MSLKHAILVMLETEPSSGYDLLMSFKESLGYFWNAKHQQIYQQLKKLTEENYVEYSIVTQPDKPDKKVYAITEAGIEEVRRWVSGTAKPNKVNDELLVKLYGGHLTSRENLLAELDSHIETHEKMLQELYAIEATLKDHPESEGTDFTLPYITLRRGIIGEKAWLEWALEAKELINQRTEEQ